MMAKNTSHEHCGCTNYKVKEFLLFIFLLSISDRFFKIPFIFSSLNIVKNVFLLLWDLFPVRAKKMFLFYVSLNLITTVV